MSSMQTMLDGSTWPILSLPPLPPDTKPLYPSLSTLYADVFTNPFYCQIFAIGLCIWYSLDMLGCHIYKTWVPLSTQHRMQEEQFAGHFISHIHALMIAGSSLLMVMTYNSFSALNADPNDIVMRMFKYSATFSAAYFLLDAIFISMYYKQAKSKTVAFVIHHCVSGICIISCIVTGPIMTYIYALFFLIEWSTVVLNIRYLCSTHLLVYWFICYCCFML